MWFFRLSPVIISVAILGFPLEPATEFHGPLHADKVQHFLTYGFLALLIALGCSEELTFIFYNVDTSKNRVLGPV